MASSNPATSLTANDDNDEHPTKCSKYPKVTPAQLSQLIQACSTPTSYVLTDTSSPMSIAAHMVPQPTYFNSAKYKDICCKPIKPL